MVRQWRESFFLLNLAINALAMLWIVMVPNHTSFSSFNVVRRQSQNLALKGSFMVGKES